MNRRQQKRVRKRNHKNARDLAIHTSGSMYAVPAERVGHRAQVAVGRIQNNPNASYDPARRIGAAIAEALDPVKAPGRVRTLADMTPEEREKIIAQYKK